MLALQCRINETLRSGWYRREVPLMLWVSLVDWDECKLRQKKGVCDDVAAVQKADRFFLRTGGRCVFATPASDKTDYPVRNV